ncbi:FAD-dependent oxidoreductase [Novipirellula sp. SH528]|uniref:FAD-dependent oxidoreductase n=1 Tax=Novipirellula sp. SH528 TaxID=3454466 RepID=UPI003FA03C9E
MIARCTLFLIALALHPMQGRADDSSVTTADVCVYSATPARIAAAVSAAKAGHTVTLVEPTDRIGGLVTSGLSYSDFRSFESLTGFFLDFANRVEADYVTRYGADSEQVKACFRGTHGEPSVNLKIFEQMLAEHAKITVIRLQQINSVQSTEMKLGRKQIESVQFRTADSDMATVVAKMYIDASYEGDLMAMAGEPYHVGRESRSQYGEPMAGNADGQADGQVQGYNLRLIMTADESNKRMPVAPEGYRREDFVDVLEVFASGKLKKVFGSGHDGIFRAHVPFLPNGKTDVNDTPRAAVRLSMPDINDGYPDGDAATRAEIRRRHYDYNIGLLYFLQNDDAVPAVIRDDARQYGWCKDEFIETGGVPPQLYIREARRMVGQHVFTGHDTEQAAGDARTVLHRDSIAIGDYIHNCHGTGREGTRFNGTHQGEFYKVIPPYQIRYGVIVPQKTENLLVPVACSASHFGFAALRLEPIWCSLGQAAGWAAAISIRDNTSVQRADVEKIQQHLHADRSATIYVADVPPTSPHFAAVQWLGTRGGLHGLASAEQPKAKSLGGQYNEAFAGHSAELDLPMDTKLAQRWSELLETPLREGLANRSLTRGQWITGVYDAIQK